MRAAAATPLGTFLLRKLYAPPMPELECEAFGMKFSSPVGIAAGFDTNGNMIDALRASGFGFVEVGSITPRPQSGSAARRLYRLEGDHALIYNSVIESAGVERVIANIKRTRCRTVIGCNIAKNHATDERDAPADFLRSFRSLYQYADYFTVNVCDNSAPEPFIPRTKEQVEAILEPLFEFRRGQNQYRPVLLKISPDLSDEQIDQLTDIMLTMPLDGLVACGGTTGRYGLENSTREIHSLGRTPGIMCGAPQGTRPAHRLTHLPPHQRGLSRYRLRRHCRCRRRGGHDRCGSDTRTDMFGVYLRRRQRPSEDADRTGRTHTLGPCRGRRRGTAPTAAGTPSGPSGTAGGRGRGRGDRKVRNGGRK